MTPRAVIGRALDRIGQLTLPLAIGGIAGYYAADQGVPFLPTMLEVALGWGLVGLLLIAIGRAVGGKVMVEDVRGTRIRRRIVLAMVLAILAVGGRLGVHIARQPSALTALSPVAFDQAFEADSRLYRESDAGMEQLLRRLETPGALQTTADGVLSAAQEALVLESWRALLDYSIALDQTRVFYEDYWRYDPSRLQRSFLLRSFLLTYAAELALYEKAARFSKLALQNPNIQRFLDAAHDGLPEGSLSRYRQELLGGRDQARVLAGEQYLQTLDTLAGGQDEARALSVGWLWRAIDGHLSMIKAVAPIDRATLTVRADAQLFKRQVRRVWFPLQKGVAEHLGDTRVRRIGWYLISHEQQEEADALLQPGDILLSRKNWYLSNVGLPGFWPHAILYHGDPSRLATLDADPEVRAWILAETGRELTLLQLLQQRYPTPALLYQLGHEHGPYRVIEAISEGVSLSPLSHAAGDYLAALRPRLTPLQKAQAIEFAFSQYGKPYDFDFDFATDSSLVCTELVWRAYREHLTLPLVQVMGRATLPANELALYYAAVHGTPQQQLDFVAFLDGSEATQAAAFTDEAAFLASGTRVKWDVSQQ